MLLICYVIAQRFALKYFLLLAIITCHRNGQAFVHNFAVYDFAVQNYNKFLTYARKKGIFSFSRVLSAKMWRMHHNSK